MLKLVAPKAHSTLESMSRAKRLREGMGFRGHGSGIRWAKFLGIGQTRWSNVESQGMPFSTDLCTVIKSKCPGITKDWLQDGEADGLNQTWLARLGLLPEALLHARERD
jgi:hypothetical protein